MQHIVDIATQMTQATSAEIFKFECALALKHSAMIAVRGEDTVLYELEDALRVLVRHRSIRPLTRRVFSIEDVELLWVQTRTRHHLQVRGVNNR